MAGLGVSIRALDERKRLGAIAIFVVRSRGTES